MQDPAPTATAVPTCTPSVPMWLLDRLTLVMLLLVRRDSDNCSSRSQAPQHTGDSGVKQHKHSCC